MTDFQTELATKALDLAIPLLIKLGDFIGNAHGRCEAIGACRVALDVMHGLDRKQPQSTALLP